MSEFNDINVNNVRCESICVACGGTGTSYWGDDCYGSCLECCCINCSKFNSECTCDQNEQCGQNEPCVSICVACGGTGTSYWSDDCYGSCLECCCINCSKFNSECTCKYCDKCESIYMKDEEHICYLCEKCGKYVLYEYLLQDHCIECNDCNKLTPKSYLRTNGKCDICYDLKKV